MRNAKPTDKRNQLNDARIRQRLLERIRVELPSDDNVALVEELGIFQGNFRVDVAAVNGSIHGYEIKSDADSLLRLNPQISAYSSLFQYLTVVVGARHLTDVRKALPSYCGILLARSDGETIDFKQIRKAKRNKSIRPDALVQLLWKDEALNALENLGVAKGLRNKPRQTLWQKLTELLSAQEMELLVTSAIKARSSWRADRPRA